MSIPQITLNLGNSDDRFLLDAVKYVSYEELTYALAPLKDALVRVKVNYSDETDTITRQEFDDFINNPIDELKEELLKTIFLKFVYDQNNVFTLVKNAAPDYLNVWKSIIIDQDLSIGMVSDLLGHEPHVIVMVNWDRYVQDPLLYGIEVTNYFRIINKGRFHYPFADFRHFTNFRLYGDTRAKAFDFFLPEEKWRQIQAFDNPSDILETKEYVNQIANDLSQLYKLAVGDFLPPKPFSLAKLKTLSKQVNMPSFGIDTEISDLSRSHLLITAYGAFHQYRNTEGNKETIEPTSPKYFARFVIDTLPSMVEGSYFLAFLPKFNGFSKYWAENRDTQCKLYVKALINIIKEHPNQWIEMKNLPIILERILPEYYDEYHKDYIESRHLDKVKHVILFNLQYDTFVCTIKRISDGGKCMTVREWSEISFPFVVAYLRLLQACGILEVATTNNGHPRLMGVDYIKLTELGQYALGCIDAYEESSTYNDDEYKFKLHTSDTIISVPRTDSPHIPHLQKIGDPISPIAYKITATRIIQYAKSREDVLKRVDLIQQTFCPDSTGVWKQLIDEVNQRIHCQLQERNPFNDSQRWLFTKIIIDQTVPGLDEYICSNFEMGVSYYKFGEVMFILDECFEKFTKKLHEGGYKL